MGLLIFAAIHRNILFPGYRLTCICLFCHLLECRVSTLGVVVQLKNTVSRSSFHYLLNYVHPELAWLLPLVSDK